TEGKQDPCAMGRVGPVTPTRRRVASSLHFAGRSSHMRAMLVEAPRRPLRAADVPRPEPGPGQVLLDVTACGVCRTDLHLLDGEVEAPRLPLVLGHQIVARVVKAGPGAAMRPGRRVGVPWLGWTCGTCRFCLSGRENL